MGGGKAGWLLACVTDGGGGSRWKETADIGDRQAWDGREKPLFDGGEEGAVTGGEESFVEVNHQGGEGPDTREWRLGLGSDGLTNG